MIPILDSIRPFLRMIKFEHSIFALPFAGIAFIEAFRNLESFSLNQGLLLALQISICMVSLRSAAMGFNRIIDRHFDAANPRTKNREIPAGIIPIKRAYSFVAGFSLIFIVTAFWISLFIGVLSFLAIFFVFAYSYTKRFTFFCHYFLGLAIGIAPSATYIAITGQLAIVPLLWTLALAFSLAGFDIIFACMDAEYDRQTGLYSVPAVFGIEKAKIIAASTHALAFAFFMLAVSFSDTGWIFLLSNLIIGGLFFRTHSMARANLFGPAFVQNNKALSLVIFIGLALDRFLPVA